MLQQRLGANHNVSPNVTDCESLGRMHLPPYNRISLRSIAEENREYEFQWRGAEDVCCNNFSDGYLFSFRLEIHRTTGLGRGYGCHAGIRITYPRNMDTFPDSA